MTPALSARPLCASVLAGLILGATAGCAADNVLESSEPPGTAGGYGDCPELASGGKSKVDVDYVDFVHANDTEYIAGLDGPRTHSRPDIQGEQLTVRCSFSRLADATGQKPPPPRNGDAAFLRAGTQVYSIKGWSPQCRLAAKHDGEWYVYLAYKDHTRVATPKPCALRRA